MIKTHDVNALIATRRTMQKLDSMKTHILPAFSRNFSIEDFLARSNFDFSHPQRA